LPKCSNKERIPNSNRKRVSMAANKQNKNTLHLPPFPPLTQGEYHWEGTIKLPAWAGFQSRRGAYASRSSERPSDGTVNMMIAVNDDRPAEHRPAPEQVAAFAYLLEHQVEIRDQILATLFPQYPEWRRDYAGDYDLEENDEELSKVLPVLKQPSELKNVIGLSTIHFSPVASAEAAYLGFEFGCPWEEEHGLGVLTHQGRIVTVGHADVCLLERVAENDLKKQKERKR
jgi:hypothetical protein